jgi:hypothetical protein
MPAAWLVSKTFWSIRFDIDFCLRKLLAGCGATEHDLYADDLRLLESVASPGGSR